MANEFLSKIVKIMKVSHRWIFFSLFMIVSIFVFEKYFKIFLLNHFNQESKILSVSHSEDNVLDPVGMNKKTAFNAVVSEENFSVEKSRDDIEKIVVDKWLRETGGFRPNERADYIAAYTEEQLVELATSGDVLAQESLIDFYIYNARSDEVAQIAEMAITQGSLYAIDAMANVTAPALLYNWQPLGEVLPSLLEAYAYLDLLELRGGGALYDTDIPKRGLQDRLFEQYGYVLSEKDYEQIEERARSLYQYFEIKRQRVGLGGFNNVVPTEVKTFVGG